MLHAHTPHCHAHARTLGALVRPVQGADGEPVELRQRAEFHEHHERRSEEVRDHLLADERRVYGLLCEMNCSRNLASQHRVGVRVRGMDES